MYAHVLRKWSLAKILMYFLLPVLALLVSCCPSTAAMHLSTPQRTQYTQQLSIGSVAISPLSTHTIAASSESERRSHRQRQQQQMIKTNHRPHLLPSVSQSHDLNNNNNNIVNNNEISNNNHNDNHNFVPSVPNYSNSQKFTHNTTLNDTSKVDSNSSSNQIVRPSQTRRNDNALDDGDNITKVRLKGTIDGYTKRNHNERDSDNELQRSDGRASIRPPLPTLVVGNDTFIDEYRERQEAAIVQHVAWQMRVKQQRIANHRKLFRLRRAPGNGGVGGGAVAATGWNRREPFRHINSMSRHNPFPNSRTRKRRFCSARDPITLAFEAPTVFEGKVRSMSSDRRRNFSVTFEVKEIYKRQSGLNMPMLVRLKFAYRNASECDIYREQFRSVGHVRDELESGRLYILFVNQMDVSNFTILGQPLKKTRKAVADIRIGVSEKYGECNRIDVFVAETQIVARRLTWFYVLILL